MLSWLFKFVLCRKKIWVKDQYFLAPSTIFKALKTALIWLLAPIFPYLGLGCMLGMGNIGASYKYLRKSPCEEKLPFFVRPSRWLRVFWVVSSILKTLLFFENFLQHMFLFLSAAFLGKYAFYLVDCIGCLCFYQIFVLQSCCFAR